MKKRKKQKKQYRYRRNIVEKCVKLETVPANEDTFAVLDALFESYRQCKNMFLERLCGIGSLANIQSFYTLRNAIRAEQKHIQEELTPYGNQTYCEMFGMQGRFWVMALSDTCMTLKSMWTNLGNMCKTKLRDNHPDLTKEERAYCNYVLSSPEILYCILNDIEYDRKPSKTCNTTEIRLQEGIKRLDANSIFLWTRDSLDDELIIPSTLQVIESRIIRPGQHKIRVKSRTPAGLVNAVTNTSSYTNNDGVAGPFVITLTIEEDGKEYVFYIPRFLSLETSKNLDNFFNMYSPSAMSEEYMDSLYEDTPCLYVKQDTALELYHLTGKQFYKDFLKKSKNSIIKRYFDRGQEKEIIDFLQFGFFASSSLDKFRKIADEREMSVLSAYILEEQKKKAPKTTTKFTI